MMRVIFVACVVIMIVSEFSEAEEPKSKQTQAQGDPRRRDAETAKQVMTNIREHFIERADSPKDVEFIKISYLGRRVWVGHDETSRETYFVNVRLKDTATGTRPVFKVAVILNADWSVFDSIDYPDEDLVTEEQADRRKKEMLAEKGAQNAMINAAKKLILENAGEPKSVEFIGFKYVGHCMWARNGVRGRTMAVKFRATNGFGAKQIFSRAIVFADDGKNAQTVPYPHYDLIQLNAAGRDPVTEQFFDQFGHP